MTYRTSQVRLGVSPGVDLSSHRSHGRFKLLKHSGNYMYHYIATNIIHCLTESKPFRRNYFYSIIADVDVNLYHGITKALLQYCHMFIRMLLNTAKLVRLISVPTCICVSYVCMFLEFFSKPPAFNVTGRKLLTQ